MTSTLDQFSRRQRAGKLRRSTLALALHTCIISILLSGVGRKPSLLASGGMFFLAILTLFAVLIGAYFWWTSKRSQPNLGTEKRLLSSSLLLGGLWALACFFFLRSVTGLVAGDLIDTLEADRAALLAALGGVVLLLGLLVPGRHFSRYSAILVVATLVMATVLLIGGRDYPLTGNSGYDLQLLLPGACLAIWSLTQGIARSPWVHCLSVVATAAYAITTPVVGGALVLALWLLLSTIVPKGPRAPRLARSIAWLSAGVLMVALSFSMGGTQTNPVDRVDPDSSSLTLKREEQTNELGGVGVRTLIWGTIPALISDLPMGVGTGQFQATYPPYRSQKEIEITSHGRQLEQVFEVEHPHNDLLYAFAEQGVAGGILFGLGWLSAIIGLTLVLFQRDKFQVTKHTYNPHRRGFAFATLAMLAVCLFHSPLLTNFVAGPIALLMLGMSAPTVRSAAGQDAPKARFLAVALLAMSALVVAQLSAARSLDKLEDSLWGSGELITTEAETSVAIRPDSFQANAALARQYELDPAYQTDGDSPSPEIPWTDALKVRPHSIEALVGLGRARVRRGDLLGTLDLWSHARDLDPGYGVVLRNLKRLGADLVLTGELKVGIRELAPELLGEGAADDNGNPIDLGSTLLAMASEMEREAEVAAAEGVAGPDLHVARGLTCAAQWSWGREHAEAGDFATALRSYRQARRETARQPMRLAPKLDCEYVALLMLTGDKDGARDLWEQLSAAHEGAKALATGAPEWARATLEAL